MTEKTYSIHDKWTDIDKLNNVDVKSVDGVIESVKINGEEAGGGGGSSDFSTATLTVNGNFTQSDLFMVPVIEKDPNNEDIAFPQLQSGNNTYTVILYKGRSTLMFTGSQSHTITVSGNIETAATGVYIITGDCTITIS